MRPSMYLAGAIILAALFFGAVLTIAAALT